MPCLQNNQVCRESKGEREREREREREMPLISVQQQIGTAAIFYSSPVPIYNKFT